MRKIISLIKASMTENMGLFRLKNKSSTKKSNKLIMFLLALMCMFIVWTYANIYMEPLVAVHMEHLLLTLFVVIVSIMTLIEGIYKSGNLLFNCKDDDLMFSLPIKRSTVLFIRMLKFYVFELMYNSLFLIPVFIVYVRYVCVGITFWITALIGLIVLPIIPIAISCLIGLITSAFSSRFKYRNIVQIVVTMVFVLAVLFLSMNMQNLINGLGANAGNIDKALSSVYYPAGLFTDLATNFNIIDLLIFVGIHIAVLVVTIFMMSRVYFRVNSRVKENRTTSKSNKQYKFKAKKPMIALIKKEIKRFVSSPVFVINAGFGLVLYIVIVILLCFNVNELVASNSEMITTDVIESYIPAVVFGIICCTTLMTSITSSMISLEGRSFNILKSLPIKPYKIIKSKIYAAIVIMIPFILIGDLLLFVKFRFNIIEIAIILVASVLLPLVSETIGIIVNLRFPKMDAENDTEVVKQSASSGISVFIGMALIGISGLGIVKLLSIGIQTDIVLLGAVGIYALLYLFMHVYLRSKGVKKFNEINA